MKIKMSEKNDKFIKALLNDKRANQQYGYTSSLIDILLERFCPHLDIERGCCKVCNQFIGVKKIVGMVKND